LTNRDNQVVEFLSKCPCYSNTLKDIFYPSQRVANKRLKYLSDYGYLNRKRDHNCEHYFYYISREPKQKQHLNYIAKTYKWIKEQGYEVLYFAVQKKYDNVIPDMVCVLKQNDKIGTLAVEIELSNNNIERKIKQYESSEFKKILFVSKREIDSNKIEVINLDLKKI